MPLPGGPGTSRLRRDGRRCRGRSGRAASDVVFHGDRRAGQSTRESIVTSPSMSAAPRRGPRLVRQGRGGTAEQVARVLFDTGSPAPRNRSSMDGPPCPAPGARACRRTGCAPRRTPCAWPDRSGSSSPRRIIMNFASASAFVLFWSGWYCRASLRNAFLISSGLASRQGSRAPCSKSFSRWSRYSSRLLSCAHGYSIRASGWRPPRGPVRRARGR